MLVAQQSSMTVPHWQTRITQSDPGARYHINDFVGVQVPESTRTHVSEIRDELEYALKHERSLGLCTYAGAFLIRGLSDSEILEVTDELQNGRQAIL